MKFSKSKCAKNAVFCENFKEFAEQSKFQLKIIFFQKIFRGLYFLYCTAKNVFEFLRNFCPKIYPLENYQNPKKRRFFKDFEENRIFRENEGWYLLAEISAARKKFFGNKK